MKMTITAAQKKTIAAGQELHDAKKERQLTIGCDLGDKTTQVCVLDARGEIVTRQRIATTPAAVGAYFSDIPRSRVVLEVGTHSRWFSAQVSAVGHEVIIANPRQLPLIYRNRSKSDELDAERLARLGRVDPALLCPVKHRSDAAQADLSMLRARDVVVRERVRLINHARGIVKPLGFRLPKCTTNRFAVTVRAEIPKALMQALGPILTLIRQVDRQIAHYDRQVAERAKAAYPELPRLVQVNGVGVLTALAYVLTVEDKSRFAKSRDVGPFLGLVPRKSQTGADDPELRITKCGDPFVRRLLVQCAQRILGPFGADSDLRRYGLRVQGGGGKNAKKRATVAVARKLAVLLHRLWTTGEQYQLLGYQPSHRKAA
jgi:transposase